VVPLPVALAGVLVSGAAMDVVLVAGADDDVAVPAAGVAVDAVVLRLGTALTGADSVAAGTACTVLDCVDSEG